jgi:hypothetical protein
LILVLCLVACDPPPYADASRRYAPPTAPGDPFATVIHEPTAYGVLDTPITDEETGKDFPAGTACETCHSAPAATTLSEEEAKRYHEVEIRHGTLTCDQCHDDDRRQLHLADDTPVAFLKVLDLCAQCHGPELRDYEHGAHGGGNGFWDASRGGKLKNNCVDCHEPHAPDFATVRPVFHPNDRNPLESR